MIDPSTWVGPSKAARILGISKRHVLRLVETGMLKATRTDIGRLIDPIDLERLRQERDQ